MLVRPVPTIEDFQHDIQSLYPTGVFILHGVVDVRHHVVRDLCIQCGVGRRDRARLAAGLVARVRRCFSHYCAYNAPREETGCHGGITPPLSLPRVDVCVGLTSIFQEQTHEFHLT